MHQHDFLQQIEMDLLHQENAPDHDMELELIAAVNRSIRSSGIGRDNFVDRVNLCLRSTGKQITKNQVNKWLASSQENSIPAWVMPSICWAVASIDPLTTLLNPLGYKVMDIRGELLKNMAENDIESKLRQQRNRQLEKAMLELMRGKEQSGK